MGFDSLVQVHNTVAQSGFKRLRSDFEHAQDIQCYTKLEIKQELFTFAAQFLKKGTRVLWFPKKILRQNVFTITRLALRRWLGVREAARVFTTNLILIY